MFDLCLRALLSLVIFPAIFVLHAIPSVKGNTEILNFAVSLVESPDIEFPDRIQFNSSNKEISLNITPVLDPISTFESGVWFTLDFDDPSWSSYEKFTLRASWPASHPCDIYLKIFEPLHIASQLQRNRPLHSTRKRYAHVYAVNTGVPTPSSSAEDMTWLRREPVPVTLVLEPLLFGVVPESVVPVIFVLLVAIGLALALLPRVQRFYDPIVKKVQKDAAHTKSE